MKTSVKKHLSLLCCVLMLLSTFPLCGSKDASVFFEEQDFRISEDGALSLKEGSALSGKVEIPEKIGEIVVQKIAPRAFEGQSGIVSLDMPDTVVEIGAFAFYDCTALESIRLSTRLRAIPDYCFDGCEGLEKLVIPSSVLRLGSFAFNGCKGLREIELPYSFEGALANPTTFNGCDGLKDVYVASSYGAPEAFPKEIVHYDSAPSGVNMLPEANEIYVSTSGVLTGDSIRAEEEELVIPSTYKGIAVESIQFLSVEVTSDNGLKLILSEGIKRIESQAFYYNLGISSIQIPQSIEYIAPTALYFNCEDIYYSGTKEQWNKLDASIEPEQTVHCSDGDITLLSEGSYYITPSGKLSAKEIPATESLKVPEKVAGITVRSIAPNAFMYRSFKTLSLPSTLEQIDERGLSYCNDLESVDIPKSVTAIGKLAFAGCAKLEQVGLPDIEEIPEACFLRCSSLQELELPKSVKRIGDSAFEMSGIQRIDLSNIEYIGECAFLDSDIKEAKLSDKLLALNCYSLLTSKLKALEFHGSTRNVLSAFELGAKNKGLKIVFKGSEEQWQSMCERYSESPKQLENTKNINISFEEPSTPKPAPSDSANNVKVVDIAVVGSCAVAVREDGTVKVYGETMNNPLWGEEMETWTDIVSVSGVASHYIGLKRDGTVVSVGFDYKEMFDQEDITQWRNVKRVFASCSPMWSGSFAILEDGSIVSTRKADNPYALNYKNVKDFSTSGGFVDLCLLDDGSIKISGENAVDKAEIAKWKDVVQVVATMRNAIALTEGGDVLISHSSSDAYNEAEQWSDIARLFYTSPYTGNLPLVGQKSDGSLVVCGDDARYDYKQIEQWTDIVKVAAGDEHAVGLKSDGTLVHIGSKDCECGIAG